MEVKKNHNKARCVENTGYCINVWLRNNLTELCNVKNSDIKYLFLETLTCKGKAEQYYSEKFHLDAIDWKHIYLLPETILRNNAVKETQFKILHKIIPTKKTSFYY